MKKFLFIIILVLIISAGVFGVSGYLNTERKLAVTENMGNPPIHLYDEDSYSTSLANDVPESTVFGKVDLKKLGRAGLCSDRKKVFRMEDCIAETAEETLPVNRDRTVVFRTVVETGLNEPEDKSEFDKEQITKHVSVRKIFMF
ncbi:MAG: hypothetical protein IJT95_05260 [Abditibacteriota bacterium]|nr:hypothetical protein [Abditibacteriota bacterium]